ncbi:uncharacterized protein K452DRAFT_289312 [Aplosporella prunicola CBS 121167]|uniref:DUF7053 domain-containing protein n=1 Tax=Aplosporella prunicola CBS 121167 TaxID=1176127 RepID=A0A6A6B999_9PEZI|nr:uncharacterized protein K452DRAFT_289312 [Aplosporella prunicola CBS 121167]KAF2139933.1 hypothetical protein K452DRAFT_289312 [Aplosporella prunicola CBS 121167]
MWQLRASFSWNRALHIELRRHQQTAGICIPEPWLAVGGVDDDGDGLFATGFTHATTTALPLGTRRRDVLALLHDHAALIGLNPLVVELKRIDGEAAAAESPAPASAPAADADGKAAGADAGAAAPDAGDVDAAPAAPAADTPPSAAATATYSVTDRLALLPFGLWEGRVSYAAAFTDTATGVATAVRAPMGVLSQAEWFVEGDDGAQLVLRETARVRCSWLVRPLVESTMRKSHEELCGRFVEELGRRSGGRE